MLFARYCWRSASRACSQRALKHVAASKEANSFNAIINDAPETDSSRTKDLVGSLSGRLIAVKDNIVTSDLPTTAASKILSNHWSPFEATIVKLLRHNGATISSKANLDEFGMGSHSQNSFYGPIGSPLTRTGVSLSPGGSSGGSAIAVATDQCWAALGTDTGGSVRLPAAYTGTVGFKPSYGLLSRWGVIQYANSLDTVGILARNAQHVGTLFQLLNQYDSQDPTSLPTSVRDRIKGSVGPPGEALRIGVPLEYIIAELSPAVRAAYSSILTTLQSQGHTLIPVSLPSTRQALSAYYVIAPAEASSNLAKYDGIRYGFRREGPDASPKQGLPLYAQTRGEGFGPEVQRRVLLGAYTLSSEAIDNYFIQAQKVRRLVQKDFDRVFARRNPLLDPLKRTDRGEIDILLTPTSPTLPPTVDEVKQQSPVESYMNDVFTVPASLAGLPAANVPVKIPAEVRESLENSDAKSTGMQIIGQFGDDETVLKAAQIIEDAQT